MAFFVSKDTYIACNAQKRTEQQWKFKSSCKFKDMSKRINRFAQHALVKKFPSGVQCEFRSTFHLQSSVQFPRSLGNKYRFTLPTNSQLFRDRIYLVNSRRIFDAIAQKRMRMMFNLIALGMAENRWPFHYRRVAKHLYRCRIVEIQFRKKQVRRVPMQYTRTQ